MKRVAAVATVLVVMSAGVILRVNVIGGSPLDNVITLRCSDSVGQQGRGGEKVVGGVEGLVLPGSGAASSLRPLRSASGQRYYVYKAFLAVSASAAPYATVSVVHPNATLYYGAPSVVGKLANAKEGRELIAASRSQVRLPVCGKNFTGYVGGIIVAKPTSVTLSVSSPHQAMQRVTVFIGNGP
jgi:hypothetical protein